MNRRQVSLALAAVFLVALGLRVVALFFEPPHHPDEFFQYLEPAWHRLTGAGVETWEWRRGVRSWVLPTYHGAWMALCMRLGVRDGLTLGTLMRAHWALVSLTLVWAGWRGGCLLARRRLLRGRPAGADEVSDPSAAPLGYQGGLLAALLCAAFPMLVRFSIHTLSELASLFCMVWALVLAGESVEAPPPGPRTKATWLGVMLGLGFCLRIQHAPVALVIALWLLLARRFRTLAHVAAVALGPVLLFGAVDWVTWGSPFHSSVDYIRFNLFEGGANIFGKMPIFWYPRTFFQRLPVGLPVLGLLLVLGLRASWPFVASALGLVALLSTQAHKEERFAMLFWPLVLIPAAAYAGSWLAARAPRAADAEPGADPPVPRARTWLRRSLAVLFALLVLADGARHCRGNDFPDYFPERFQAQIWVGRQPDVTGLLYDEPLFVGGYLWWSRPFPQLMWKTVLLANPLVTHVLTERDSEQARTAQRAGFAEVYAAGRFVVLRRPGAR
jgi:hypothetical protein